MSCMALALSACTAEPPSQPSAASGPQMTAAPAPICPSGRTGPSTAPMVLLTLVAPNDDRPHKPTVLYVGSHVGVSIPGGGPLFNLSIDAQTVTRVLETASPGPANTVILNIVGPGRARITADAPAASGYSLDVIAIC